MKENIQQTIQDGSVTDLIKRFLSDQDVMDSSRLLYSSELNMYIRWIHATGRNFWNMNKADAIEYKRYLADKKVTTQRNYLGSVNIFYKWAAGHVNNLPNIFKGIRRPRNNQIKQNPLTSEKILELYGLFNRNDIRTGLRDRAMISLMIEAGLKRQEIMHLMIGDIIQEDGRYYALVPSNGSEQKIRIELTIQSYRFIQDWLLVDPFNSDNHPLFPGIHGNILNPGYISQIVTRYLHKVGMSKGYSCDSLRYSGAMIVYEETRDITRIKAFLRHKSIFSTQQLLKKNEAKLNDDGMIQKIFDKHFAIKIE